MEIKESFHTSECVGSCHVGSLLCNVLEKRSIAHDPALLPMNRASSGHIVGMAENTAPKDEQNPLRRRGGKETINFPA